MQTHSYLPERKGAFAARIRATDIETLGISPEQAARLNHVGVRTLGQLKQHDPQELASKLSVAALRVRQWQAYVDFMEVDGIGKEHGRLLVNCGIRGVDDLLRRERQAVLYTVARQEATKPVAPDGTPEGGLSDSEVKDLAITEDVVDRWFDKAIQVA